jgi:anti-anti-sigma factor
MIDDGGLEAQETAEGVRIRMWGAVDGSMRPQASAVLMHTFARPGRIELDASELEFIDSSGLAFVLQLMRSAREDGRAISLSEPTPVLTDLLEVLGLADQAPWSTRPSSEPSSAVSRAAQDVH